MGRPERGWKVFAVVAVLTAAFGVWNISIGSPWLGAGYLVLASGWLLYAYGQRRKARAAAKRARDDADRRTS